MKIQKSSIKKITCRRKESYLVSSTCIDCSKKVVFLNKKNWNILKNDYSRTSKEFILTEKIIELLSPEKKYSIIVRGGGVFSRIEVLQKTLIRYLDEDGQSYIKQYEPQILDYDIRRVEPKKYGGRGARARFQKSYR